MTLCLKYTDPNIRIWISHLSLWNTWGTSDLIDIQNLVPPIEEPLLQPESGAVIDKAIVWQS